MILLPAMLLLVAAPQEAAQAEHGAIQASDIDRSAGFYRDIFGLRPIDQPMGNRRWLDLGRGLALHILDGRTAPRTSNRDEHLALRVDDLAVVIARLDRRGIAWTNRAGDARAMQTRFDAVRQIYVQDPDGYWIEVSDRRGQAPR